MKYVIVGEKQGSRFTSHTISYWTGEAFGAIRFAKEYNSKEEAEAALNNIQRWDYGMYHKSVRPLKE